MSEKRDNKTPQVDLLYRAAAIADALGMTEAQVYHLHAREELQRSRSGAAFVRGTSISTPVWSKPRAGGLLNDPRQDRASRPNR